MSAGNNGMGAPDGGDDPFGYLYRPEGDQPAGAPPQGHQQPSYHQVRPVGERTYGGQARASYGQQPQRPMPETGSGGGRRGQGPQGGGQKRNGLLIGAIAVVTAVVFGVGAVILLGGDDTDDTAGEGTTEGTQDDKGDDEEPEEDPDSEEDSEEEEDEDEDEELPVAEITELRLDYGAELNATVDGARSDSGVYIAGLNTPGATITWSFDFKGEPGLYKMHVGYSVPGVDQGLSFAIDSDIRNDKINMSSEFSQSDSDDWDTNWVQTWAQVDLNPGEHTIQIGCDQGDSCDVIIDKLWIGEYTE